MAGSTDPRQTFLQEAGELLVQLEEALLDVEAAADPREPINTAFRALHTLKGSGAMFGYDALAGFAHEVETALDRVRRQELHPSEALIRTALAAKDHMRLLIEAPDAADPADAVRLLGELQRLVEALTASEGTAEAASSTGRTVRYRIGFQLPRQALVMGTNPLLLLDELRALGPCQVRAQTDAVPLLEDLDPEACYLRWQIDLETAEPVARIEDVFIFVRDDAALSIEPIPSGEAADPSTPPAAADRDADKATLPEGRPGAGVAAVSIRVAAERVDALMDQVGELVIAQSRLRQIIQSSTDMTLRSVAEEIERLSAELRDTTMSIRMVPIGALFGRFRRVVRDLAHELGREVRLVTSGEETELDKTVIESLNDPLLHLIRNAIDHGLEPAADRAAAGKSAEGEIHLGAVHSGAQVLITIGDDGRGMNRERIRAKAEEQGLLAADAEISDSELLQLIFHPGFSTAQAVTSVSGRGVGMDVVKRAIDSLRGTIDIASTPGAGSRITLRLPLTLAIIDGLLVRVGSGRYVIPLAAVEECVELSESEDARSNGRNFLNIRGELVPYLRLREVFSVSAPPEPYQKIVIVSSGDLRVGLVVDQIIGDHQTVIKSLSHLHADVESFSGATILGDGTVALILDVPHLIEFGQMQEQAHKKTRVVA